MCKVKKWRELIDMRLKPLEEYDAKFRPILLELDMQALNLHLTLTCRLSRCT